MEKYKIVFLCHFSNSQVRDILSLKKSNKYNDFASWVPAYIVEFEKYHEIEFHIVSPHYGLRQRVQSFTKNGIYYHFFQPNNNLIVKIVEKLVNKVEELRSALNRKRIKYLIDTINPNIVILCGAENPYYSSGVLDIKDKPVYVILQTLLNDAKRIEMGVGSDFRRKIELKIFKHAGYFCTSDEHFIATIKKQNSKAQFLPAGFPTSRCDIKIPSIKDYHFVFFARRITKYKGIEDLLYATATVKQKFNEVRLNVIGECNSEYMVILNTIIEQFHLESNVHFAGFYKTYDDVLSNVVKANVVVVPGITASLNSTVRESMLLELPTICYETKATEMINKNKMCLLTAKIGDTDDLAKQMLFTIMEPEKTKYIAQCGKEYAVKKFSNEAIVEKLIENCRLIVEKEV